MKKQIKKLSLNKKTISNLTAAEMNVRIGGGTKHCSYAACGATQGQCGGGGTRNGNTCPGRNTCYTC